MLTIEALYDFVHLKNTAVSKLSRGSMDDFDVDVCCDLRSTWDSGPVPTNRTLRGSIVVPYPVEADLSGKGSHHS